MEAPGVRIMFQDFVGVQRTAQRACKRYWGAESHRLPPHTACTPEPGACQSLAILERRGRIAGKGLVGAERAILITDRARIFTIPWMSQNSNLMVGLR